MLKYLEDNTWCICKNEEVIIKAKFWHYPTVDEKNDFYKVGVVGDFECKEQVSEEDSKILFNKIEQELKKLGCKKIIGPMNGNTWQNYRLTTYYGDRPAFMLEPYTPEYFIEHWLSAGFSAEEEYSSYITETNTWYDKRIEKLSNKFSNLLFRKIEEKDLEPIFDLSLKSFIKNPYYINIDKQTYLEKYGKMMVLLKPNVSWVVYDGESLVGYIFAILNGKGMYKENDSIILKTAAINDDRKYAGLGVYLLSKLVEESKESNVNYVIHALMHDRNPVQNIIKNTSEKIRAYTLYKKDIL